MLSPAATLNIKPRSPKVDMFEILSMVTIHVHMNLKAIGKML